MPSQCSVGAEQDRLLAIMHVITASMIQDYLPSQIKTPLHRCHIFIGGNTIAALILIFFCPAGWESVDGTTILSKLDCIMHGSFNLSGNYTEKIFSTKMVEFSPFSDDHLQKAYKSVVLMKFGFL